MKNKNIILYLNLKQIKTYLLFRVRVAGCCDDFKGCLKYCTSTKLGVGLILDHLDFSLGSSQNDSLLALEVKWKRMRTRSWKRDARLAPRDVGI